VIGPAAAQQLTEDFELATFPPANWIVRNQSTWGSLSNCWYRLTTEPWPPHGGAGHAGANFECTTDSSTISGWLLSPHLSSLQNGNALTFWTRTSAASTFPDRLQARLCVDTAPDSCGAAGSTGTTSKDVGSYTTVLVDVNPTLTLGGYPNVFTQFSITLAGLPAGLSGGRIAFRYFVTGGGPGGANSDVISIDDIVLTDTSPVELLSFSID